LKRLGEIFKRVAAVIPGASEPETVEEARDTIVKDTGYRDTLKRWANTVGGFAAAVAVAAVVAKSGVIVLGALAIGAVWGGLRAGIAFLNRDIRENRAAELAFVGQAEIDRNAPAPTLENTPDLAADFKAKAPANQNAARIRELEQQVAALEVEAAQKAKARQLGLK
jgi:hypothetical protein